MTLNNRLNWGMALILLYPAVSFIVFVFHGVYLIDISPVWLTLESALETFSYLASVAGIVLVMLPYLDGSKDSKTTYRRVDKSIAWNRVVLVSWSCSPVFGILGRAPLQVLH